MKLFKQEEVDKAAHRIHPASSINRWAFRQGVEFAESKIMDAVGELLIENQGLKLFKDKQEDSFPNGFESWYETFYEVVCEFFYIDGQYLEYKYPLLEHTQETIGIGGLYELAKELTDKFELLHKGRKWDGEFDNEIREFLEIELSKKY